MLVCNFLITTQSTVPTDWLANCDHMLRANSKRHKTLKEIKRSAIIKVEHRKE